MNIFLIISVIIVLVIFIFGFKYFTKTTTIFLLLIIGGLTWDYQISKLPIYDLSKIPQGYFDQQRNIIPADQDQYIKLLKVIDNYSIVTSGSKNETGVEQKFNKGESMKEYTKLRYNYTNTLNGTGLELHTFLKQNSNTILNFEKVLLKSTNTLMLGGILFTGNRGDLDPSYNIEVQMADIGQGSQNLVKDLTMIGGTYCYIYSLQKVDLNNKELENKCITYFDWASKIAYRQYNRKGGLISKLVALTNMRSVLRSVSNIRFEKIPTGVKEKVIENFKFLGNTSEEELIKNYKIDEYNTVFVSVVNETISTIESKKKTNDSLLISLAINEADSEMILKAKNQSLERGKYFFMLEDADKPINELGYFLGRYSKSLSRYLLSVLDLDKGEFVSNLVSAESIITLVPRLTGIERQYKEIKSMYLEYAK